MNSNTVARLGATSPEYKYVSSASLAQSHSPTPFAEFSDRQFSLNSPFRKPSQGEKRHVSDNRPDASTQRGTTEEDRRP